MLFPFDGCAHVLLDAGTSVQVLSDTVIGVHAFESLVTGDHVLSDSTTSCQLRPFDALAVTVAVQDTEADAN